MKKYKKKIKKSVNRRFKVTKTGKVLFFCPYKSLPLFFHQKNLPVGRLIAVIFETAFYLPIREVKKKYAFTDIIIIKLYYHLSVSVATLG